MPSAVKNYIDFILDYNNNYNNDWKEYLRFFIGFAISTILVDFFLELDWVTGAAVFLFLLLLFEFLWVNILFIFRKRV
ncbi:hypothetical protein CQ054_21655 [Ochrobactrum sp. MYb29]|nr:hypothetical protein CWE02_09750 [Brucella pituitosa]PRA79377.1 hypothetical protein CQ054_21655 [Ochrobactrum sp. MYb29]TCQ72362.1 hypothetical protein EDF68_12211 [Ochrobactrum sp. BH3]